MVDVHSMVAPAVGGGRAPTCRLWASDIRLTIGFAASDLGKSSHAAFDFASVIVLAVVALGLALARDKR